MARRSVKATVSAATVAALALAAATSSAVVANTTTASTPQYIIPAASSTGVNIKTILTAGDVVGDQTFVGVPDGMGVLRNADGTLSMLVNHEISISDKWVGDAEHALAVSERPWGGYGSFVSKLTYNPMTQKVTKIEQFPKAISWWDYLDGGYTDSPVGPDGADDNEHTAFIDRFCSAYLAPVGQLEGTSTAKITTTKKVGKKTVKTTATVKVGYNGAVYITGEEAGDESRAFAIDAATGNAVQLPRLGLASWENYVVAPKTGDTTVLLGLEDGVDPSKDGKTSFAAGADIAGSQVFLYEGTKKATGSFADKAGLTNGELAVMAVTDAGKRLADDMAIRALGKGKALDVSFKTIPWNVSGNAQNLIASRVGTSLGAIEDGAFNPSNPNEFWFVTKSSAGDAKATAAAKDTDTTSSKDKRDGGGIWKLVFTDVKDPGLGAKLTLVLDGSEAPYVNMPDNIDFDSTGKFLLVQEDPGNNTHVSRILSIRTADAKIAEVATFDKKYFGDTTAATYITSDEESSGITNANAFLRPAGSTAEYFVLNAQVHPMVGSRTTGATDATRADSVLKTRPDITGLDAAGKLTLAKTIIEGGQVYVMSVADLSALNYQ